MNSNLSDWVLDAIGKKLTSVFALVYVYDDEKNFNNFQEISLSFLSDFNGRLLCGNDGASIDWDILSIEESNLGSYGENIIEDVSQFGLWSNLINKVLISASFIFSTAEKCCIGIQFDFDNNGQVSIINLGDELYVFSTIPENIINSQKISFTIVAPSSDE